MTCREFAVTMFTIFGTSLVIGVMFFVVAGGLAVLASKLFGGDV